jgi:hypothetical protein
VIKEFDEAIRIKSYYHESGNNKDLALAKLGKYDK